MAFCRFWTSFDNLCRPGRMITICKELIFHRKYLWEDECKMITKKMEIETKADAIGIGTLQLVNFSSRVSQEALNMLEEVQVYLQTDRSLSKVSKQETFEWCIRVAYAYKMHDLHMQDIEDKEESKKVVNIKDSSVMKEVRRKTLADDLDDLRRMTKANDLGYRR
jgi:hypothetical protein